ncbi:MAG TPA: hypothetical protein VM753_17175 [Anaeromyxobacter sp.]|jgi:hypothetical protein|nr:hypothetical protein [Anaeromyxobacter sp.]
MIRLLCVASVLLLAQPALSADDPGAAKAQSSQKSQKKSSKKAKKADPAPEKPSGSLKPGVAERFGISKPGEPAGPTADQKAATQRARTLFKYAAESCERPEKCDTALRDDADRQFMNACRDCTTTERCEMERTAILEGRAAGGPVNVCETKKK